MIIEKKNKRCPRFCSNGAWSPVVTNVWFQRLQKNYGKNYTQSPGQALMHSSSSSGQSNLSKILLSNLYETKPGEKCS